MSEPAVTEDPKKNANAPDAAPRPDAGPSNAAAPKGADPNKPANAPAGRTTPLRVRANYENIPGASKNGPKDAIAATALWFDPLTIASTSPDVELTKDRIGVTKGGSQVIATQAVPLQEEGEPGAGEGIGTLTAQLKYAADLSKTYKASIKGDFKKGDAQKADTELKKFIPQEFAQLGDLDRVKELALAHMQETFPDAKNLVITLTPNEDNHSLQDAGKTHIYYKARDKPSILLNVPVVAVAEKQITSGATTTKQQGTEVDAQAHGNVKTDKVKVTDKKVENEGHVEGAVQTVDETWHKENKRTYDEIVATISTKIDTISKNIVTKLDADSTYHDDGKWEDHIESFHFDDYTKNVKGGSEEGDKDKKNWAAWLQDGISVLKDVTEIPILKDLPKVGPVVRKLNEWGLAIDLVDKAAGMLAVRGKVHYKDTHEDTEAHDKQHDKSDNHGEAHRTVTRVDKGTLTTQVSGVFTSMVSTLKTTHGTDNTTTDASHKGTTTQASGGARTKVNTDDYDKTQTQTDVGGSVGVKANQHTTTEITWSQSVKETTTKPILDASIVSGDGEVSSSPFPPPSNTKK